ncbi:MAG: S8 family serine peptidase, partial [bacterium]|nr:S8 family serine peptidase [bacterium]
MRSIFFEAVLLLSFFVCGPAAAALIQLETATLDPHLLPRVPTQPMSQTLQTRRGTAPYLVQARAPITAAWKEQVTKAGGVLHGYIPHHAFLVELTPAALVAVAALPEVAWIGMYAPAYKLSPGLQNPRLLRQRAAGASNQCEIVVQTLARVDVADVCAAIAADGGTVVATANEYDGLVRAVVNQAALAPLAARAAVAWIEPYVPPKLLNDIAVQAPRMNVQTVWTNYGLTGKGQVIAVCDTGLDTGLNTSALHPDFTNRVKIAFARARASWSDPNGHGTHTSGSVLGNGSASGGQYRGCSYEAQLVMQSVMDAGGSLSGLPADLNVLFYQTYTNDARIHSDSWGSSVYGAYDTSARQADQFMWNYKDMLLVFAASNDGTDSNGDGIIDPYSVGSPGTAKNVLTVGAAENQRASGGYSGSTWYDAWPADYPANPIKSDYISWPYDGVHQGMAAFSSRGPCSDARVKPDIAAPGTDIISCRSRAAGAGTGWGVYNSYYVYMGGTSMATPLTAGAAG